MKLSSLFFGENIMRIITVSVLRKFWEKHPDIEEVLKAWHEKVKKASWESSQKIKDEFGTQVKIINRDRACFKIKGNNYRLVIAIDYQRGWVFIKFIGTHAEYDKIDVEKINNFKLE